MMAWLQIAAGLGILILGADLLVRGASSLASRAGVSPLVIGLTVVAFGTSSPEIAVSLSAVASDEPGIAMGNAVGSNIFNILFILGVAAIVCPLTVHQQLLRVEIPLMIGASLLLWMLVADGSLGRIDAATLALGIVAYTTLAIRSARRESDRVLDEYKATTNVKPRQPVWLTVVLLLLGLAVAVIGSRWLVAGSVVVAQRFGISELVIGLTIVAAGTSLPEVATSVVAASKGHRDIAIGNVVGSNLFNILGILGLAGMLSPRPIEVPRQIASFDVPMMVAAAVACLPIALSGFRISRPEGGAFLLAYVLYVGWLVSATSSGDAASLPSWGVYWIAASLVSFGAGSCILGVRSKQSDESKSATPTDP